VTDVPPWFDRRKQQNRRSRTQEKRRAQEIGGRVQPGSGSSRRAPQDVRQKLNDQDEGRLEQIKYTDKDRITIKVDDLIRLYEDALLHGRDSTYLVDFDNHGIRIAITVERTRP
jgi:hypothetical protein